MERTPAGRASQGVDRRRERFGGFNLGAAFFGWLVAVALSVLLSAIVGAVAASIGSTVSPQAALQNAAAGGIVGGIVLLIVALVAYFGGGYVAGRMSRFDGGRQGLGVWLIGIVISIALAVAAAVLGAQYNVLSQINLPSVPADLQALGIGGLIGLLVVLVGTALAAVGGGKVGERYHHRVDREGAVAE
jgi:amino acid transporter